MSLRTTTLIALVGLVLWLIIHFARFPYEALSEYSNNWWFLLSPLLREFPLSILLANLYLKQK